MQANISWPSCDGKTNLNTGTIFHLNAPPPQSQLAAFRPFRLRMSPIIPMCLQLNIYQAPPYVQSKLTSSLAFLTCVLIMFSCHQMTCFLFCPISGTITCILCSSTAQVFINVSSRLLYLNWLKLLGCYISNGE